jgi:hypothetical protein
MTSQLRRVRSALGRPDVVLPDDVEPVEQSEGVGREIDCDHLSQFLFGDLGEDRFERQPHLLPPRPQGGHDRADAGGRVKGLTLPGPLVLNLAVLEPDGGVTSGPMELGGRPLQEGADGLAAVPILEREGPLDWVVGEPVIGASDPREGPGDGERLVYRHLDAGAHTELLEGSVPLPLADADPHLSVQ